MVADDNGLVVVGGNAYVCLKAIKGGGDDVSVNGDVDVDVDLKVGTEAWR